MCIPICLELPYVLQLPRIVVYQHDLKGSYKSHFSSDEFESRHQAKAWVFAIAIKKLLESEIGEKWSTLSFFIRLLREVKIVLSIFS